MKYSQIQRSAIVVGALAMTSPRAIFGCASPEIESKPVSEEQSRDVIPTSMTLLKTGSTFLSYVSVQEGDSARDLEGAKSDFYYLKDSKWVSVPGCRQVDFCDVSVLSGYSGLRFRAEFSAEGYVPSSQTTR